MEQKDLQEFNNHTIDKLGRIYSKKSKKYLKLFSDKDGYNTIVLKYNGKRNYLRVGRLVAKAFIPNPNNHIEIDHVNRIRDDDRVENLRWISHSDQMKNRKKFAWKKPKIKEEDRIKNYLNIIICVCGGKFQSRERNRHNKTKKHLDFLIKVSQ